MIKKILLHVCCAPCATAVLEDLRADGFEVTGYFYNPSIHPWKEFKRRLDAVKEWAPAVGLPMIYHEEYPLEKNIRMLLKAENRCFACFSDRMERTAELASNTGIELFTSTLSVSPYQNHVLLQKAGDNASEIHGVRFMYKDFRKSYRRSIELSRSAGLYRQPYCGCVFSERDRYLKVKSPGEV
ncbi:MAG: epoxyqueuosine reductase QueH [Candidatus Fermentibacteria bacterium]|nr:epoxyqueuosine reductase QueH [Candidatus Fermentibacteria bacterium]